MIESGTSRDHPYVWPSWICGLLSGDRACWWSGWFRAHYQDYARTEERDVNRLSQWRGEHAALVAATAAKLRSQGYDVTVEDQNTLRVRGESATVGGKPDIVAISTDGDAGLVVDCKTGKPRESDYWQVLVYLALLTLRGGRLEGRRVRGEVVYAGGTNRAVWQTDVARATPLVWDAIRTVAAAAEPPRVPSSRECRYCDIACCPDRESDERAEVATEAF